MLKADNYSAKPTLCNQIVYEDESLKMTKLWTWDVAYVSKCNGTSICKALLNKGSFNMGGKSTFVSYYGKNSEC